MSRFDKPWSRILLVAAILFVGLFGLTESVRADSLVIDGETIPAGQVVDNDAIISGENVVIDGTVLGDVFAVGKTVTVNGKVDGSLFSAAETITISGEVTGTVYILAGTLELSPSAATSRNVLFAGFRIVTESGSVVGRDLHAIGIGAQLSGTVGRDLNATIGLLEIIGVIRDSLADQSGESAGIDGIMRVINPSYETHASGQAQESDTRVNATRVGEWILGRLQELLLLLLIAGLFVLLKPSLFYRSVERVRTTPFPAVGHGLIAYVVGFAGSVLLAFILVFVSVALTFTVSWKLALLVWALGSSSLFLAFFIFIIFVYYGSKVIVSYLVGRLILQRLVPGHADNKLLAFLLGLTLYVLLVPIPVLGWLLAFVMSLLGLGAVWLVYLDNRRAARAKVEIAEPEAAGAGLAWESVPTPGDAATILAAADVSVVEAIEIGERLAQQHVQDKTIDLGKQSGPWTYNETLGSSSGAPLDRAALAVMGILGPTREQSIDYIAAADSGGSPLRGDIEYKITGKDFDARWWSITAYCPDYLISNKQRKYSVSKSAIKLEEKGDWEVYLTPEPREDENWIHSGGAETDLTLVLRLYNPAAKLLDDMSAVEFPEIHPVAVPEMESEGEESDE